MTQCELFLNWSHEIFFSKNFYLTFYWVDLLGNAKDKLILICLHIRPWVADGKVVPILTPCKGMWCYLFTVMLILKACAIQIFRKEPFFYGHDNYDQLVKIAKVSVKFLSVN